MHRYLNEFATKQWQNWECPPLLMNVITLTCETTCVNLHNHGNASIKRHDKLTVTDKHISTNVQSVCPLAFTRALKRFCHWLIAWSVMLCWIPDHAKIISSGYPGDLTGSFVSLVHPPDWVPNHWLYQCSQQYVWCARCATTQLSICCASFWQFFKKIIQTVQMPSFLWKRIN